MGRRTKTMSAKITVTLPLQLRKDKEFLKELKIAMMAGMDATIYCINKKILKTR
jgi:hypothetical protein